MDVFKGREKPQPFLDDRTAERADVILPRERLLGIGSWVVNREARIQSGGAAVKRSRTVPLVGAVLGGDHHGGGRGAAGVRVFLRRAQGKFLDGVGREVLQESADPVI